MYVIHGPPVFSILGDGRGATALLAACEHGHAEVARVLLAHGASVEQQRADGSSALAAACHGGHVEVAGLARKKIMSQPRFF